MMWEKLKKVVWPTVQKLLDKLDQKNTSVDKKEVKESQVDKNKIQSMLSIGLSAFFVLFTSFVFAQVVSALTISSLLKPVLAPKKNKKDQDDIALKSVKTPNYRDLNKDILKRNIFNDEGKFPDESSENNGEESAKGGFDINAPCTDTKLSITLVGTIFLDGGHSVAIINEKGVTDSDTYHEGDLIIGSEEAEIVKIERTRVIINNKGRKECLENSLTKQVRNADKKASQQQEKNIASTVSLTGSYVESELGDGFGKIIQSARLVPNSMDSKLNGYKIFSIKPGSLFDKIGLKEGDVITKVNNVVMSVERGFSLYEAFQESGTVIINALGDGTNPKTITVLIK